MAHRFFRTFKRPIPICARLAGRLARFEPLENRTLLSVTILSETFKTFDVAGTGPYSGVATIPQPPLPDIEVTYSGTYDVVGTASYTSPTDGTWTSAGNTTGEYSYALGGGPYTAAGHGTFIDDNGALTGNGYVDSVTGLPPGIEVSNDPYPATGTFDPSTSLMTIDWPFLGSTYSTSGTVVTGSEPFDTYPTSASWNGNDVDLAFEVTGPPTTAATHTTPASYVNLHWAAGPTFGDAVSGPLADSVPIYWNQATGSARISGLPAAPPTATHLLVYTDGDGLLDESNEANNIIALTSPDSIGLYDPNAVFHVKNDLDPGAVPDDSIVWGWGTNAGFLPIAGDWDGDGFDTIGLYDPNAVFHVKNDFTPGAPDDWLVWGWGSTSGYYPIAGDWDGDGLDTIGLYSPTGTISLKNDFTIGGADVSFQWGEGTSQNWLPVAGDWDGDGIDTVGLYAPNGVFLFKNDFTGGAQDAWLTWGWGADDGYLPIAGDWDGDTIDTIGLYDANAVFAVKNHFSSGGAPDDWLVWGWGTGQNWLPITGDWNGGATPLLAAGGEVAGATAALTQADLQPIVTEAIADWAGVGLATEQLEALLAVDFIVADLPGAQLGLATADAIYIDINAAGHGWFVDPTPGVNEEFQNTTGKLLALDPQAVDRMDLLTVVSHELGHTLGLADLDSSIGTLMSGTLETGLRREPGVAEIDALFAQL